jgi:hypothetical protein
LKLHREEREKEELGIGYLHGIGLGRSGKNKEMG